MKACPQCKDNKIGMGDFCGECGSALVPAWKYQCQECGHYTDVPTRFCTFCGGKYLIEAETELVE